MDSAVKETGKRRYNTDSKRDNFGSNDEIYVSEALWTKSACGAFVHALEDEYEKVRSAALGSDSNLLFN